MPYFTAACTTGLGLAWKAGCAAEVIGNTNFSIGGEIYKSKILYILKNRFIICKFMKV